MATYKIGKLKINTSDGLAFRFGDGEIRRLKLGKNRKSEEPVYNEEYLDDEGYGSDSAYAPAGYEGRFSTSRRSAYEDDYADDYEDGYADDYADDYDDGYADGDGYYDDRGYAEDDYADDYADDYGDGGYDDGDDGYYDEDGQYDDRYSDEDADQYADDGYMDESPLMRYVDENDWVTFVLLFLLPPLGIYLLWRRHRFERPIRIAVSAASAIWFIIVIVLIISAIFSGSGDVTTEPKLVMTTPTPTVAVETSADPSADASADPSASPDASAGIVAATVDPLAPNATATPIAVANNGSVTQIGLQTGTEGIDGIGTTATGDVVYTTGTGAYYHNSTTCANIEAGAQVSTVTLSAASQQAKAACPLCYPNQKTYYATTNGSYYHVEQNCSGMEDASVITREAAEEQGKQPCPACIEKKVQTMSDNGLKFATSSTRDRSGITVYATAGGRYFHTNSSCSGMTGATSGSLLQGLMSGKEACPVCCESAGTMAYATQNGTYYHNTSDCSGMENAYRISVGEALVLGKRQCSVCWTGSTAVVQSGGDDASGVYVYGTQNGRYYHTTSNCSGMTGASRYTLKSMLVAGRPACPECCSGADTTVYATEYGTYYHSFATCSGMGGASKGTLAQALAYGKKKCPECWSGSSTSSGSGSSSGGSSSSGDATSDTMVYATKSGSYYHTQKYCNGMSGASRISLTTAINAGKRACPSCAESASQRVYSSSSGAYYHSTKYCNGAAAGSSRTLESALLKNQTACPICLEKYNSSKKNSTETEESQNTEKLVSSDIFRSGTSGIKVYAVADGKHYHTNSTCSGMTDASRITLETALNYGKTGCSKCASSANTVVYAVRGGKYYHTSRSCAGDGAVSGTRGEALAYGFDPCPYCVTKVKEEEEKENGNGTENENVPEKVEEIYKTGTSGIKVWGTVNGKYYHTDKTCAGSGASHVTLETALNYSKRPCPSCAGSAGKTVYSTSGDKYYHTSRSCAGSDARAGDFAQALALGKKECPSCIGGSESYEISDIKYSAPAETTVYVDLDSDMLYYHKSSYCGDAGLHGGTGGPLGLALDMKYKACPFCAPPTSVS